MRRRVWLDRKPTPLARIICRGLLCRTKSKQGKLGVCRKRYDFDVVGIGILASTECPQAVCVSSRIVPLVGNFAAKIKDKFTACWLGAQGASEQLLSLQGSRRVSDTLPGTLAVG